MWMVRVPYPVGAVAENAIPVPPQGKAGLLRFAEGISPRLVCGLLVTFSGLARAEGCTERDPYGEEEKTAATAP